MNNFISKIHKNDHSTYNLSVQANACKSCEEVINPNTVYSRFHHRFCSIECRDLFDERNDNGHIDYSNAECRSEEVYHG